MKAATLFISTLSCLILAACSTTSNQTTTSSHAQILEQDTNINAFPSTAGNVAKLIKSEGQTCIIEFTGYLGGGQVTEHWTFNPNGLISATSSTVQYPDQATLPAKTSITFDIHNPDIQANFKKLQSNFDANNLAQCK